MALITRPLTLIALLSILPAGLLSSCGGRSVNTNDTFALEGQYGATATEAGQTTPAFTGQIAVSGSGDLSGSLTYGPYAFDVSGEIAADGTISCTTFSNSAENVFIEGNGTFTGDLNPSGDTFSGTITYTPQNDIFGPSPYVFVMTPAPAQ